MKFISSEQSAKQRAQAKIEQITPAQRFEIDFPSFARRNFSSQKSPTSVPSDLLNKLCFCYESLTFIKPRLLVQEPLSPKMYCEKI